MLIIDGYNLIFTETKIFDKNSDSLENARSSLIRRIKEHNHKSKEHIIIAFDGKSGLHYPEKVQEDRQIELVFSQSEQSADQLILNIISASAYPKTIELVSSDRELAESAKKLGTKTCSSNDFIARISNRSKDSKKSWEISRDDEPVEKAIGLSPDEAKAWLKIFSKD
ncbi:MAG: NYN domain-containing protein [Candidatus Brocadiia bacterium]